MRFARIRLAIHKLQGRRSGSKDKIANWPQIVRVNLRIELVRLSHALCAASVSGADPEVSHGASREGTQGFQGKCNPDCKEKCLP